MPSNENPSILSQVAKDELSSFLETAARAGLRDIFDFSVDTPGFIADDTARTVPFALAKGIARSACRQWARGEGIPSAPVLDAGWGALCEPYLDDIGEYPGDGAIGPPFRGGQCSGANYNISCTTTVFAGTCTPIVNPFNTSAQGPISGPFYDNAVPIDSSGLCPGTSNTRVFLRVGPSQSVLVLAGASRGARISGLTITPQPGQPNNCGDPAPQYDPPNIPPGLPPVGPVPIRLPGIGPVDVGVSFNPDGSINVNIPDLGIDLDVPNPFAPTGGGGDGPGPGEQGQPGDAVDVGPGDVADETDPERNLVGVLVQIVDTPPRANRTFNQTEAYTKGPYYVYFGGAAGLSLNPEGAIARQDQFYYAPPGANRFRVVPNAGFTLRVTPYYEED